MEETAEIAEARALLRRGRLGGVVDACDRAIAALDAAGAPAGDPRRGEILLMRARAAHRIGIGALDGGVRLLADLDRHGWEHLRGHALRIAAAEVRDEGQIARAEAWLARAEEIAVATGDTALRARALCDRARCLRDRGDATRALRMIEDALALAERESPEDAAVVEEALAWTLRVSGHVEEAARRYARVRARGEATGDVFAIAMGLGGQAMIALDRKDPEAARDGVLAALAAAEEAGARRMVANLQNVLGDIARRAGDLAGAEARYAEAVRPFVGATHPFARMVNLNRALLAIARGDDDDARALVEPVLADPGPVRLEMFALATAVACRVDAPAPWQSFLARLETLTSGGLADAEAAETVALGARKALAAGAPARAARAFAVARAMFAAVGRGRDVEELDGTLARLADSGVRPSVGAFELVEPIGRGGTSEVWRAVHHAHGTPAAVKVLAPSSAGATFRAEVRAVAAVSHPSIVTVLDFGHVDGAASVLSGGRLVEGSPFLVMELAEGGTLERACGSLPWRHAREVLARLLDALAFAHARGVVHGDVKPANVLLATSAPTDVRLADFGLAAARTARAGTPAYMAPEQFVGGGRGGSLADLYAVGCLATALVAGEPPFSREDATAYARAHLYEAPPPLPEGAAAPEGFDAWRRRLLEKDPAARFACAADAAWALARLPDAAPEPGPRTAHVHRPDSATLHLDDVDAPARPTAAPPSPTPAPPAPVPADWRDGEPAWDGWRLSGAGLALVGLRAIPMVGREAERDALWAALKAVRAGDGARAVALVGPPGSGRSRLLAWLAERAEASGAAGSVRIAGGAPPPLLEALEPDADVPADPIELARRLDAALARRAAGRAVVACVEHADDPEAFAALARRLEGTRSDVPVLLVLAADAAPPGLAAVSLPPLGLDALVALGRDRLGLEAGLALELAERSAGSPQFVVQAVEAWARAGALVPGKLGYWLRPGVGAAIPEGLAPVWRDAIARATAGLGARARGAVEAAAVLGVHVDAAEWREACAELGAPVPERLLERLLDCGVAASEPGGWRFTHGLAREAVLAAMGEHAAEVHAACARTLARAGAPDARLLPHLLGARRIAEALAVAAREADRLYAAGATDPLVALAERLAAASPPADDARWLRIRVYAAGARAELGAIAEAEQEAEAIARHALAVGLPGVAAEGLRIRAVARALLGRWGDAASLAEEGRALAEAAGDRVAWARCHYTVGTAARGMGRQDEARRVLEEAREAFAGEPRGEALADFVLGLVAREGGDAATALALLRRARARFDAIGNAIGSAGCDNVLAELALERGDTAAAEALFRSALERLEAAGSTRVAFVLLNLALLAMDRGALAECRAHADRARRVLERAGRRDVLAAAYGTLLPALAAGAEAEWSACAERVAALVEETGFRAPDLRRALQVAARLAEDAGFPARAARARALAEEQARRA
ncbi:MAG: protein kinase domain-containing protein [Myxococcota bacterium]